MWYSCFTENSQIVHYVLQVSLSTFHLFADIEPPSVKYCPDDVTFPTRFTDQVAYTWAPPVFSDNSGRPVDVVFGCSAIISNDCQEDGNGHFSVGDTEVMYNGTDTSGNQNFCNFTILVKSVCSINLP